MLQEKMTLLQTGLLLATLTFIMLGVALYVTWQRWYRSQIKK